eukprot:2712583-Prymnesium_polylepis.3
MAARRLPRRARAGATPRATATRHRHAPRATAACHRRMPRHAPPPRPCSAPSRAAAVARVGGGL